MPSGSAWPLAEISAQLDALLPGCRVELVEEIDSTNTELMRRARAGRAHEPVLLVALRQSAGRGRLGRPWQSQLGEDDVAPTLTFSLGLPLAPRDWSGLSLAVGVAVAEALDPQASAGVGLKWPNDLWRQDRKLAGILIETATVPGDALPGQRYVVIGVGINIGPRDAQGMNTPPAHVREWQPDATAPWALAQIAAPLLRTVLAFADQCFAPLVERFAARDVLRGREVQLSDGTAGLCQGVGPTGELLVHTASGVAAITSSEVSVRPCAG
ncbi:biotin--[acetyl-CoA-carboxylase] ligase [Variovorax sp. OV329]|uniref:biotin--[acetyl-CoA-carboxylase] ligase n=1 Tax=Variovorax sp. OV329 TaxID=1882825 RepID=UPI0008E441FA|nr:biotin--[acetyl-CoA-carboxylase] ligase [Variovorax sp. OV329]SFM30931.1 BirA family transcriptional regulator, biotin operon repressor / biotin-[acetyl-CoA-carboxylase] ligase [Variovorax sp. OV329]